MGYAVLPRLLELMPAEQLDAVYISHGHPDHCADLNPLLRARALGGADPGPLPVYAPFRALDAVLALDRPGMLDAALARHDFEPGRRSRSDRSTSAPPCCRTCSPTRRRGSRPGAVSVYTGDGGPDPALVELARGTDTLIAEATYPEVMADGDTPYLSTARQAARQATEAGVGRLVLTHCGRARNRGSTSTRRRRSTTGDIRRTGGLSFDA